MHKFLIGVYTRLCRGLPSACRVMKDEEPLGKVPMRRQGHSACSVGEHLCAHHIFWRKYVRKYGFMLMCQPSGMCVLHTLRIVLCSYSGSHHIVVFGGCDDRNRPFNDLHILDCAYQPPPEALESHSGITNISLLSSRPFRGALLAFAVGAHWRVRLTMLFTRARVASGRGDR